MAPAFDTHQESEVEEVVELKEPPRYRVLLHNDDYTSMEFVVMILKSVFGKSVDEAIRIMYDVHQNGIGIAGVYTKEIAETRVQLVHAKARENGFPLRASMEKI